MRHALIYPFTDWAEALHPAGLPGTGIQRLTARDGRELIAWRVPARAGLPVILHFTGNAGALAASAPRLTELAHRGYGIAALNYRGAGGAAGTPRQSKIVEDALTLYDTIDKVPVIYGTSLGAAVAVQVAARRDARALVLETPFTRLCDVARYHYPWVPACTLIFDERWDSLAAIGRVKAPVLVLHGDADRVIPVGQGRTLYDAARGDKELVIFPGGRHNDLRLHGAGAAILDFLDRHLGQRPEGDGASRFYVD